MRRVLISMFFVGLFSFACISDAQSKSRVVVPDDYSSIEEAYSNVDDGGVIVIKPGKYEMSEMLEIDRTVTFRGDSFDPEDVVLNFPNSNGIKIYEENPIFKNLTIISGEESGIAFGVIGGSPKLFNCVFTSKFTGLLSIGPDAKPIIENCVIKGNGVIGAAVKEKSRPEFRNCEICENEGPGFYVMETGNPIVTGCKFHGGKKSGLNVEDGGTGEFRDCDFYGNEGAEISISESGNPTIIDCKIHDGVIGVGVTENGRGEFRNCEFYGHEMTEIGILQSGNPTFIGCKIHDGEGHGVYVIREGLGEFRECTIYNNENAGVHVEEEGNLTFNDCKVYDEAVGARVIGKGSRGEFTDCEFYDNEKAGIAALEGGNVIVTGCNIHNTKEGVGLVVGPESKGTFKNNKLSKNYLKGKLTNWLIVDAKEVEGSGNTPEMPNH